MPDIQRTPPGNAPGSLQYELFASFFGDSEDLSNTLELWDSVPKYAMSARKQNALRDENGRLPAHAAEFEFVSATEKQPVRCLLTVKPALIEVEDGVFKDFHPSQAEELVEEVLRKIFIDQRYGMHLHRETESWVRFSLSMIRKELRGRGHARSLNEIKRSLEIMAGAGIDLKLEGRGAGVYTNPILSNMMRVTRADLRDDPRAKWVAQLPAIISKSINDLKYRQFNYARHMRLGSPLTRWLHKRLVNRYRNASPMHDYHFAYSSVSRDSGLLNNKRMSTNIKSIIDALDELKAERVLYGFAVERRFDSNRIADAVFTVSATREFTAEVMAASARLNDGRERLTAKRQ